MLKIPLEKIFEAIDANGSIAAAARKLNCGRDYIYYRALRKTPARHRPTTWHLKGCAKCGGDMYLETDLMFNITEYSCLQCGYRGGNK